MAENPRRLILSNGESYVSPIKKKPQGRPAKLPRSYDEARALVKTQVTNALEVVRELPPSKKLKNEITLCLRLHPDMTAKSYTPDEIFARVPDLRSIGSRNYDVNLKEVARTERIEKKLKNKEGQSSARLLFVRGEEAGFKRFLRVLDESEKTLVNGFKEGIQRIERFDMLAPEEQRLGFEDTWKEGRVEVVLHPSFMPLEDQEEFIRRLFAFKGIEKKNRRINRYEGGPTFISCRATKEGIDMLVGSNPLRAVHPLEMRELDMLLRGKNMHAAPKPPASTTRSTTVVGVFDGGIDTDSPLLAGHVEEDASLEIGTGIVPEYVAHGTAVAGAVLYGNLKGIEAKDRLPQPPVYVVGIRALPTSDPDDIDLYESIDVIERAVPSRQDIKVFNISFGPRGPILADTISRFTYVLDQLSVSHKVTFCVAVGNDGDVEKYDRIQTPSDAAHALGVGAYTYRNGKPVRSSYSCKGPGRECAKVKPDLSDFGGCDQEPYHLISTAPGKKVLWQGTSYASPTVARQCAIITDRFDRGTSLVSRALLLHTAKHPDNEPDYELGHGCTARNVDDVLFCDDGSVTVLYIGAVKPPMMNKLIIPLPSELITKGKVEISWTIASLSSVDINHPGDYTNSCIEETFYPHSKVHLYSDPTKKKARRLNVDLDATEIKSLIGKGWKKSEFPVSGSGNKYKNEFERRIDCKWEPIVRKSIRKEYASLHEPFLVLQAIGRNGVTTPFDYAAIVTIKPTKFDGDLYDEVLRRYQALTPIRLRTEAEVRIKI